MRKVFALGKLSLLFYVSLCIQTKHVSSFFIVTSYFITFIDSQLGGGGGGWGGYAGLIVSIGNYIFGIN